MNNAILHFKKYKNRKKLLNVFEYGKELKDYHQAKEGRNLENKIYRGVEEVSLEKIKGSVQKNKDFKEGFVPKNDVSKFRWSNIYLEMIGDGRVPPVILYKIDDEYYVYDGNHRVSVANYLNYKTIEAEVYEYIDSGDGEELKNIEKLKFEKRINLSLEKIDEVDYKRLNQELDNWKKKPEEWIREVYNPLVSIIKHSEIPGRKREADEIFVRVIKHKRRLEKKKNKFGNYYSTAVVDYLNLRRMKVSYDIKGEINLDHFAFYRLQTLFKEEGGDVKEVCGEKKVELNLNEENHYKFFKGIYEILFLKIQDIKSFKESLDRYGYSKREKTIKKLKNILLTELDGKIDKKWINNEFIKRIEDLVTDKESLRYFKTKRYMRRVMGDQLKYTIIDYFVDVLYYNLSKGKAEAETKNLLLNYHSKKY